MVFTTLCYLEKNDCYLMLHRTGKKNDFNKGKWIGVGGHVEKDESPEECLKREVLEETGLTLRSYRCRGVLTFLYDGICEYTFLYTSDDFEGELKPCNEGTLEWIQKSRLTELSLFEGDLIFLNLLQDGHDFFSLKLRYEKDRLAEAVLDLKPMELFDIVDDTGMPTGLTRERSAAHRMGTPHRTAHVWIVRSSENGFEVLLQKRSHCKDSFPDCLDISSAGHIPAGYEPKESALRELQEELGICGSPEELVMIGMHTGITRTSFYSKPFINHEISWVYLYTGVVDTDRLTLQKEEIQSVCWMSLDKCIDEVSRGCEGYCLYEDELLDLKEYLTAHS